jgi:hypothetical protein
LYFINLRLLPLWYLQAFLIDISRILNYAVYFIFCVFIVYLGKASNLVCLAHPIIFMFCKRRIQHLRSLLHISVDQG